jgi:(2R)-ethylmalonyl-CoA mutase
MTSDGSVRTDAARAGGGSVRLPERDKPWVMRTYAGHTTAKASNELYRRNLEKGQTGLSVAFDLPTQTGYDPDDELSRGEVGKVGVSIAHRGDMATLMEGIPLGEMNTSMTINATAAWLLALYIVTAQAHGVAQEQLQGTTQNDIIKEFLARGTYAFPPGPSMRLTADTIAYTVEHVPKWNPINICSYHLQEAGATPVQEIAFTMSNAIAVLDAVRERLERTAGGATPERMGRVFGRISFFVNAGLRFIEEHAKLRAMGELWEEIGRERYGVRDARLLRFRYGVQVNSLGLTEVQPENNVQRIVLESLAVTLGRNARARAIQLPAWNEALGLPRPWDQQWSLRIQQVLAYETDVLDYPDIFEGSRVMEGLVAELREAARAEMAVVAEHGGAVQAVPYMKAALVESGRERLRRIESGAQIVVGQNRFEGSEPSPLAAAADGEAPIMVVDPAIEEHQIEALNRWRSERDEAAVRAALEQLARVAAQAAAGEGEAENLMVPTIAAARAGATTGEWAGTLREAFGSYRAPTGVPDAAAVGAANGGRPATGGAEAGTPAAPGADRERGDGGAGAANGANGGGRPESELADLREQVARLEERLGRRPKMLVGKPGLDGHSNGAEQIAVRARDSGLEVVYEGIRLTPRQIARSALQEGVHVIGLSILSGSHRELIPMVMEELRRAGVEVPVVVGGIIPEGDVPALKDAGIAAVYTPKDYDLTRVMREVVELVARAGDHGQPQG